MRVDREGGSEKYLSLKINLIKTRIFAKNKKTNTHKKYDTTTIITRAATI